jgi:hypothetical protein
MNQLRIKNYELRMKKIICEYCRKKIPAGEGCYNRPSGMMCVRCYDTAEKPGFKRYKIKISKWHEH